MRIGETGAMVKNAAMKRSKVSEAGFTMVEMLIVIALIGLIVAFLFSKLGNSFNGAAQSQAATQIADDMRSVTDAAQRYSMEKATNAVSFANLGTASNSGGPYLSMIPNSPSTIGAPVYALDVATYTTGGTAAADTVVKVAIPAANTAVCQAINYQYAGLGIAAAVPGAVDVTKDMQCFGAGPYTALKTVYIN